jgi:hypothetical protein
LSSRSRCLKSIQFPREIGIAPVKKKTTCEKFEAKVYTDHTLTRELVGIKPKIYQLGTIPK